MTHDRTGLIAKELRKAADERKTVERLFEERAVPTAAMMHIAIAIQEQLDGKADRSRA